MEKHKVYVGSRVSLGPGQVQDSLREVEFVGEVLCSRTTFGYDYRRNCPTGTRGTTQTLYRTEDGRLVVHIEQWSRWRGEPQVYRLAEISLDDLQPGGPFEQLGRAAGLARPLTIAEALSQEGSN